MYQGRVPGLMNVNDKIVVRPYLLQNPTLMRLKKDNEHSPEMTQNESRDWLHDTVPVWSRQNHRNSNGEFRQLTISKTKNYDIEINGMLLSLWGKLHPNMRPFPAERRGKQYLACCVMALCATRIYPVGEWSAEILDSIVTSGDLYYVQSFMTPRPTPATEDESLSPDKSNKKPNIRLKATFDISDNNIDTNSNYDASTSSRSSLMDSEISSVSPRRVTLMGKKSAVSTSTPATRRSIKAVLTRLNKRISSSRSNHESTMFKMIKGLPAMPAIPPIIASSSTVDTNSTLTKANTFANKTNSNPGHFQQVTISVLRTSTKCLPGQLTIDDLNAECWLDSVHFRVRIEHITDGKLYCTPNNHFTNLAECLMYFFSHFQSGIIQCLKRSLAFGFMPGPSGGYYLYDCESSGYPLFGKDQGASYMLLMKNLQILLYCMVVTLNVYTFHETFSLYHVDIESDFFETVHGKQTNPPKPQKTVTWKRSSELCKTIKRKFSR